MSDIEDDRERRDRTFLQKLRTSEPLSFAALAQLTGRAPAGDRARGLSDRLTKLVSDRVRASPQVQRLEDAGTISGYRAVIDARQLDWGQTAFVQVALRDISPDAMDIFATAVRDIPQIEACHMIAGDFHYYMRVRTDTVAEFRDLLTTQISQIPGVVRTSAILAMQTIKEP